ncbi:hypothetical protein BDV96DRAFT_322958 [Lophiotrema nucula]|uniref:Secreted protein n=1 Tax=Lophiotrema nucula TaxID=690887 RepID=A0A6A5ZLN9_9PLEO|nr:hypothetical protein BDV96DRAFT_322958 [Lophiotrema nucula]
MLRIATSLLLLFVYHRVVRSFPLLPSNFDFPLPRHIATTKHNLITILKHSDIPHQNRMALQRALDNFGCVPALAPLLRHRYAEQCRRATSNDTSPRQHRR